MNREKFNPPWRQGILSEWQIVGMNHYHLSGEPRLYLYVSMVKDRRCITEEGSDDEYLWNRLGRKAEAESR